MMEQPLKKIQVSPPEGDPNVMKESKYLFMPSFKVDSAQMPEIRQWENDGRYRLFIEVVQTNRTDHEDGNDATFNIVAYKVIPKVAIEDMNDKEFGEYQGKSLEQGRLA